MNLSCNQAHAPFEITADDDYDITNERYRQLIRSIYRKTEMGCNQKSIADVNYGGDLTFEAVKYLECFDSEETLQSALNLARSVGREIIKKIKRQQ